MLRSRSTMLWLALLAFTGTVSSFVPSMPSAGRVAPLRNVAPFSSSSVLSSFSPQMAKRQSRLPLRSTETADDSSPQWEDDATAPMAEPEKSLVEVKSKLLLAAGLCDRGFSASMKERSEISDLINELQTLSPLEAPSAGIDGDGVEQEIPLQGVWRLVYTSAIDVLNLWASPVASIGPIYQDISNPPVVVNVIDQTPRALSLLPPSKELESVLRLKVFTRARERGPSRVGLAFESVKVEPKNLIGRDVSFLPSPTVQLPRIPIFGGGDDSPAYFDILFLDENLLIIKQNSIPGADGGIFVSTKVDGALEPVPL